MHDPSVPLPDMLVIGAMKSGTTSLYRDLLTVREFFLPEKESNVLLGPDPEAACERLFGSVEYERRVAEVCPNYTKPGLDARAAEAARRLYAGRERPYLFFLAREPISRLLSHHHFISTQRGEGNPGGMTSDLAASLRDFPELIETSRYFARLQPWMAVFGKDAVDFATFEMYVAERETVVRWLAGMVGLGPVSLEGIEQERVHNPGEGRPVATPGWRKILNHPVYREGFRPFLPPGPRDRLREILLPKAPPKPPPPDRAILQSIADELRPDVAALSRHLGLTDQVWDLDAAVEQLSRK